MADGTGPSHLNMHACEPQLAGALHACIAARPSTRARLSRIQERARPRLERFCQEPFVPLLTLVGKCLRRRAKPAHIGGHLPPPLSSTLYISNSITDGPR